MKRNGMGRFEKHRPAARTALGAAVALGAFLVASGPTAAQIYTITDLGTLGGDYTLAYGLNNRGQAVGVANVKIGGNSYGHAFLFDGGTLHDLGTLPGGSGTSEARAINDAGQIVGWANMTGGSTRGFVHSGSGPLTAADALGTLGGSGSAAWAINNRSQVVGVASNARGLSEAFLYESGLMRGLGILGGNLYSVGLGINEAGTVVGYNGPFDFHAFAYDSAAGMRDLGSFGMTRNWARDINNRDQIVGGPYDASGSGPLHAFVYEGGQMRDLGVLPGNTFSIAYSINDSGDIVGYASVDRESARRAVLWRGGGALTDLNSLIPADSGWVLQEARAINEQGQIVGYGIRTINHEPFVRSFLLTPDTTVVPEPGTLSLLAAGVLGAVSRGVRRARRRQRAGSVRDYGKVFSAPE